MSDFPPSHDPSSSFGMDWSNYNAAPSTSSGYDMFDQAAFGPEFEDGNMPANELGFGFNDEFPVGLEVGFDLMGGDMSYTNMSPLSPVPTIHGFGPDQGHAAGLSLDDILPGNVSSNTHAHAGPWNASMLHPEPSDHGGSYHISGQPRHKFMQSIPSSYPGVSDFDSGYRSQPPTDTASLVSAPSALMVPASDTSDYQTSSERPAKKARKVVYCHEPGPHRTREFNNIHDLERHQRSTHGLPSKHSQGSYFQCVHESCRNPTKIWDRKDNFRSHLVRRHFGGNLGDEHREEIDSLVQRSRTTLSEEDIVRNHQKKEAAKMKSRQTAGRRLARRASRPEPSNGGSVQGAPACPEPMSQNNYIVGAMDVDRPVPLLPSHLTPRSMAPGPALAGLAGPRSAPTSAPISFRSPKKEPSQDDDFW